MTYKDLLARLQSLSETELQQTATVVLNVAEEALPVAYCHKTQADDVMGDVLDEGHFIITANF